MKESRMDLKDLIKLLKKELKTEFDTMLKCFDGNKITMHTPQEEFLIGFAVCEEKTLAILHKLLATDTTKS